MDKKTKKRLMLVTLVIVVVLAIVVAYVGAGGASKTVSLEEALSGEYVDQRIKVTGTVVDNSFTNSNSVLTFLIYNPDGDPAKTLKVVFRGPASATFGNGIVTICTGKIDAEGVLQATELVTKCPSKYESAEGSVTADYLVEKGEQLIGTTLRLAGYVKDGTLVAAGGAERFVVFSRGGEISVAFNGALPNELKEGSSVIVTGALNSNMVFVATSVALEDVK